MAPGTPRSLGTIVIRPRRGRGRGRPRGTRTASTRATIRIPARRGDTPRTEDEDDVSSLTSNPIASSSKAPTSAPEEDSEEEKEEDNEEEIDRELEEEAPTPATPATGMDDDGQDGDEEGEEDGEDGVSEAATGEAVGTPRDGDEEEPQPIKRGRGRPRGRGRGASVSGSATPRTARGRGRGRGRGRAKGRQSTAHRRHRAGDDSSVFDEAGAEEAGGKPFRRVNGKVYIIEGDEVVFEDNEKGNTKIDMNGNLLGGTLSLRHSWEFSRLLTHKCTLQVARSSR